MEKKNIYDEPSKKDVERIHQQNYDLRKQMKENRKNPYKGTVIKAGTYNYDENKMSENINKDEITEQKSDKENQDYEDKVNEILEKTNIQEEVNSILSQNKKDDITKKILEKNDNQTRVKKIVEENER